MLFLVYVLVAFSLVVQACVVDSVCYNNADCPDDRVCEIAQGKGFGQCRPLCRDDGDCAKGYHCDAASAICEMDECQSTQNCESGFECQDGRCISRQPLDCEAGMVSIENQFCIDIYEASRPDATDKTAGLDSAFATSRKGVVPWQVKNNQEAQKACEAAGKSLCKASQWFQSCRGPKGQAYSYGDTYDPAICNGIDTYCDCAANGPCADRSPCPFSDCREVCGAQFGLDVTGLFEGCTNRFGVFDMNGNLWEHVLGGDETQMRGGAYNCADSKTFHRCDYIPGTWRPLAQGFRCCSTGRPAGDGGPADGLDGGPSR